MVAIESASVATRGGRVVVAAWVPYRTDENRWASAVIRSTVVEIDSLVAESRDPEAQSIVAAASNALDQVDDRASHVAYARGYRQLGSSAWSA